MSSGVETSLNISDQTRPDNIERFLDFARNDKTGAGLGFYPRLVDQIVIARAFAIECLSSTSRTSLHVAAENVQLAFGYAAVMTRLSLRAPIFFLRSVANALKTLPPIRNVVGISLFT
jgi:hypothetical protein